jgi:hypothetical protein
MPKKQDIGCEKITKRCLKWTFSIILVFWGALSTGYSADAHPLSPYRIDFPKRQIVQSLAYYYDFEGGDGGWTPSGPTANWEYGPIIPGVYRNCGFTAWPYPEPTSAHSGTKVWGTTLDGCYSNFNGISYLIKTFDFRGRPPKLELRWWQWYHVFEPYDQATVLINDQEVWRVPDNVPTVGWVQQKVDISAFSGLDSVTIKFALEATSDVNRMGWYLDDIEISPQLIFLPIVLK